MVNNKIYVEHLPKKLFGKDRETIDFEKSIGIPIKFEYMEITGILHIEKCEYKCVYVKYKDNELYKIDKYSFLNCGIGKLIKYTSIDFLFNVGHLIKDSKREFLLTDRYMKGRYKTYRYTCNICGWDNGEIDEYNLKRGIGCGCCSNKTVVLGINTIYDTDPWMLKFGLSEEDSKKYTKCSGKKVEICCPNCQEKHRVLISNLYKQKTFRCGCSDNKPFPEKFIYSMLKQLYIEFVSEVRFDWSKVIFNEKERWCRYDFVIDNLIIEVDGAWHKTDNKLSGLTAKDSIFIDSEKDRLANENGYKLIRIDASKSDMDFIKENILNSELSSLYDLNLVNWSKCLEYSLGNRIKEIAEFRKNNMNLPMSEIAKNFNVSVDSMNIYMNKAHQLGWINYDKKLEQDIVCKYYGRCPIKHPIKITTENGETFHFKSKTDAKEYFKELRIKIDINSMSNAIRNNKLYKNMKIETEVN